MIANFLTLTVSSDAAALISGKKPTSSRYNRKFWSSIPYTLSKKRTIAALWSGQKPADMSGSNTNPSMHTKSKQTNRMNLKVPFS